MANWDNLSTKQVQDDMALRYDLGIVEGYEGVIAGGDDEAERQHKADAALARFFRDFSPYQRGYIFGHLTQLHERAS